MSAYSMSLEQALDVTLVRPHAYINPGDIKEARQRVRDEILSLAMRVEALEAKRETALITDTIAALEAAGCQFWACEGPTLKPMDMKTCNVCVALAKWRGPGEVALDHGPADRGGLTMERMVCARCIVRQAVRDGDVPAAGGVPYAVTIAHGTAVCAPHAVEILLPEEQVKNNLRRMSQRS